MVLIYDSLLYIAFINLLIIVLSLIRNSPQSSASEISTDSSVSVIGSQNQHTSTNAFTGNAVSPTLTL